MLLERRSLAPQTVIIPMEIPVKIGASGAVTRAAFLHAVHTEHAEQFVVQTLQDANVPSVSLAPELDG